MSLDEFQRVLVRMYTSPLFLTDLETDFKQSLQGYQLSELEIETLTQLIAMKPQIERFADGLYRKKFGYLWGQFSTVNNFFGWSESEVLTAFKDYYDFKDRGEIEDIDYFANFLNDFAQTSNNPLIKYFKEAVKCDQIICKARMLLPDETLDKINVQIINDKSSDFRNIGPLTVTKSPAVFFENFNYNIPALYEGLDINELQHQPTFFAFVPILGDINVKIFRLSPIQKFLVEKAEIPTSIDEIVREAASFQNLTSVPKKFQQACIVGIQKLCEKGILVVA